MKRVALLISFALIGTAGCGAGQRRTENLMDDIRGFNQGIRWHKHPQAALRIPPKEREDFLDEREDLEEDLRIADFEIQRVRYNNKRTKASVNVKWEWLLDSRGVLHKSTTKQNWQLYGKRWLMVKEKLVRGEPMPGVPDPADEEIEEIDGETAEADKAEDSAEDDDSSWDMSEDRL
jgi:hypothetical protein